MSRFSNLMQKFLASTVFLGSLVIGMKLAGRAHGQLSPPVAPLPLNGIPTSTAQTPAPSSANATTSPDALKANQAAQAAQLAQAIPQPSASPSPAPSPSASPAKAESDAKAFVPSEVESYVPLPKKVEDPRMVIQTSGGNIRVRLFPALAPRNVRNIVDLARGEKEFIDARTSKKVRRPFYLNTTIHRVVSGFLIQAGCPFGNGRGGPGYTVPDEFHPTLRFNTPGIVAMAPQREGTEIKKDSNGSQFFITLRPMPEYNDKATIIGVVERGIELLNRISAAPTGPTDRPIRRIFIFNIEIEDPGGVFNSPPPPTPAQ